MLATKRKIFSTLKTLINKNRFYSEVPKVNEELKSEKLSENSKKVEINFEKQQEKPKPQSEKIKIIDTPSSSPSFFSSFFRKLFILFGGILVGSLIYFYTKYNLYSEINTLNNSLIDIQNIKTLEDIYEEELEKVENKIKNLQHQRDIARDLPTEEISFEKFIIKRASNQWNSLLKQVKKQVEKSKIRKIAREDE
eukprot:gene9444-1650_t